MLLLDELLEHDADGIVSALTIRRDSVLCDGVAGVPAWAGMEYMAQTAAAYGGAEEIRAGKTPSIPLLLGTRAYKASVPVFRIGARLIVSAHVLMRDERDLAVFHCRISEGDTELAVGDIKAMRAPNLQLMIQQQLQGAGR
jgi:predicted hotdog family 3-hydroxylacyl-ACP dehydratase